MRLSLFVLACIAVSVYAGPKIQSGFYASIDVKISNGSAPHTSFEATFSSDAERSRVSIIGNGTSAWAFFPPPPPSSNTPSSSNVPPSSDPTPTQTNPTSGGATASGSGSGSGDTGGSGSASGGSGGDPSGSGGSGSGGSGDSSGGTGGSASKSGGSGTKSKSGSGTKTKTGPNTSHLPSKSKSGTAHTKTGPKTSVHPPKTSAHPPKTSAHPPKTSAHKTSRAPPRSSKAPPKTRTPPRPTRRHDSRAVAMGMALGTVGYYEQKGQICKNSKTQAPLLLSDKTDFFWWTVDAQSTGPCDKGQSFGRNDTVINGKSVHYRICVDGNDSPVWMESRIESSLVKYIFKSFSLASFDADDSSFSVPDNCSSRK